MHIEKIASILIIGINWKNYTIHFYVTQSWFKLIFLFPEQTAQIITIIIRKQNYSFIGTIILLPGNCFENDSSTTNVKQTGFGNYPILNIDSCNLSNTWDL